MLIAAVIFLLVGLLFFTGGSIGIIRFPDFYTRLHPAGKLDSMGVLMAILGIACYTLSDFSIGTLLTAVKLLLIVAFIFITSPTSAHAIMYAGLRAGIKPWCKGPKKE